jgi:acetylornithine deacetylase
MKVLVAARGSYAGVISVFGRAGHSEETPKPWEQGGAVNAISKAVKVLQCLDALNEEWAKRPEKHHKYLDPDIIVPTMIRGGEWEVMYPERVDITFTSDFVPATKDIRGEIQVALDRLASEDSWMRQHPPVLSPPDYLYAAEVREDEPIVQTISAALADLGVLPQLVGCGSLTDMIHLVNYSKVPTVSIGPSARTAHRPDENVTVDELVAVTKAIALVILRWSGSGRAAGPS